MCPLQIMKIAVLADIHGNAIALEAVLAEIDVCGADLVVQLGDVANGPLDPVGSVRLLRERDMLHVRGNGDRMVAAPAAEAVTQSARFARERLTAEDIRWLGDCPLTQSGAGWFACHGTPQSDMGYLTEVVTPGGAQPSTPEEVAGRLSGIDAGLILSGHTHVVREVRLPDGRLVVNAGSVGLPAYGDTQPYPHVMEAGDADARWVLAERGESGWRVEIQRVPYEVERAARQAEAAGWPDWARALRTGRV